MIQSAKVLGLVLLLLLILGPSAQAAPPYQTLDRAPSLTNPHGNRTMPLPVRGYAYGYFGSSRGSGMAQRSFGIHRSYTQWSKW